MAIDEEDELFLDVKASTQINILSDWNERNIHICHGKYFWEDVNCHLTRSAADAFIKRKSHDFGELRYLLSHFIGVRSLRIYLTQLLAVK